MNQVIELHSEYDKLQLIYGNPSLNSIYGAGCIDTPSIMFVFMNPTGRNISSKPRWSGLRAPWIGTRQVWNLFNTLNLISNEVYENILKYEADQWDIDFAEKVYKQLEENSVFITNLAKCTQIDARPLNNKVFKEYLYLMYREVEIIKPKKIVTFGNQVSTILLKKNISVSNYINNEKEVLKLNDNYDVYPTYYPVGQGRRNLPLAVERIKRII